MSMINAYAVVALMIFVPTAAKERLPCKECCTECCSGGGWDWESCCPKHSYIKYQNVCPERCCKTTHLEYRYAKNDSAQPLESYEVLWDVSACQASARSLPSMDSRCTKVCCELDHQFGFDTCAKGGTTWRDTCGADCCDPSCCEEGDWRPICCWARLMPFEDSRCAIPGMSVYECPRIGFGERVRDWPWNYDKIKVTGGQGYEIIGENATTCALPIMTPSDCQAAANVLGLDYEYSGEWHMVQSGYIIDVTAGGQYKRLPVWYNYNHRGILMIDGDGSITENGDGELVVGARFAMICHSQEKDEKPSLKQAKEEKAEKPSLKQAKKELRAQAPDAMKRREGKKRKSSKRTKKWRKGEEASSLRNLKWRWADNGVPSVGMVPTKDKWKMPANRAALMEELAKKTLDPEADAKKYKTRRLEFADVDYPKRRRTFGDYVKALDWLTLGSNIEVREEL